MTPRLLRRIASVVMLATAAFWLWFGVASALGERLGAGNWIAHLLLPGGLLVGILAFARRWPAPGGLLLVLAGMLVCVGYPLSVGARFPLATSLFVIALLGLPPLVAGFLFTASERLDRREPGVPP
jgi:hypothetical protein